MKSSFTLVLALLLLAGCVLSQRGTGRFSRGGRRVGTRGSRGGGNGGGNGGSGGGTNSTGGNNGRGPHQTLPRFDEILADAGNFKYAGRNERTGRSLDRDIFTADGTSVLYELDELEPVPCELEEVRDQGVSVEIAASPEPVGSGSCDQRGRTVTGSRSGGDLGGNGDFHFRGKRAATSDTRLRWPTKTIAYTIQDSEFTDQREKDAVNMAIAEYAKHSCIRFVRREGRFANAENYIRVIRGGGCYSSVGWIYWRQPNVLSLGNGCAWAKNIPIHEFMHALGVYHQQSRPDRDQYVRVLLGNVQQGQTHNFIKLTPEQAELKGTVYSYRSVMHYSKTGFSKDRSRLNTIEPLDRRFLDIIGRAKTFSFEDLQLLNKIYTCDDGCSGPNRCPANSYRGQDCKCYCKAMTNIENEPTRICNSQPPPQECREVGQSCQCGARSGACRNLPNTQCNTRTGACECDSRSALVDGTCIELSKIMCTEVGIDCHCSRKGRGACADLPNTQCSSSTNACECINGYQLTAEGECKNIDETRCNRIGEACFCSRNGCNQLSNSRCNTQTEKCECVEDFFVASNGRSCTRAPPCNRVAIPCKCSVQGSDACSAIPNSMCDPETEACKCLPSHRLNAQGACEPSTTNLVTDGRAVAPFLRSSISTNPFAPSRGDEPTQSWQTFGIAPNSYRLRAAGTGRGQVGAIETPFLPAGRYCISFSYKMKFSVLFYRATNDGNSWVSRGLQSTWQMRRYFSKRVAFRSSERVKFQFKAEAHPRMNREWEVLMDPIIVKKC